MVGPTDETPDPDEVADGVSFGRWSALFWALASSVGLVMFTYAFGVVPIHPVVPAEPIRTINSLRVTFGVLSVLGGGGAVAAIILAAYLYSAPRQETPEVMQPGSKKYTISVYTLGVTFLILMSMFMGASALAQTDGSSTPTQQVATERSLDMTIHGGQWFWRFDVEGVPFSQGNHVVLPSRTVIKFQITSADVIHSFAIQKLGVKKDAVPGQMNNGWFYVETVEGETTIRAGGEKLSADVYRVNCAELCGKGHSQMVAQVIILSPEDYRAWVKANGGTIPESFEKGESGEHGG